MSGMLSYFAEQMFVGPIWPASMLVGLLVVYTTIALLGLIDLDWDAPDVDVGMDFDPGLNLDPSLDLNPGLDIDTVLEPDFDVPVDGAGGELVAGDLAAGDLGAGWDFLHGVGAISVRLTNFGRVPLIIWAGIFTLAFWVISYLLWHGYDTYRYEPSIVPSILLSVRNMVIAVAATKGLTQPLLGYFIGGPSYDRHNLIGATCEVSTLEATPEFGQAQFRTNAAPLLLNIRTDGPHIEKGTEVRIVGFDRDKRIYRVTQLSSEDQS